MLTGGYDTVEANIEQQQYELIACLERSFQELVSSNFALRSRFNRLEQLLIHCRSVEAHQEAEQQPQSSAAIRDNSVTRCIGSVSRHETCTGRFSADTADVSEMLPKSRCTQQRSTEQRQMRSRRDNNAIDHTGTDVTSGTDDIYSSSTVNSQQGRCQNAEDMSDIDVTSHGRQRKCASLQSFDHPQILRTTKA